MAAKNEDTGWISKGKPKAQEKAVSEFSDLLSVPSGWTKGEKLAVDRRIVKGQKAWFVQQPFAFTLFGDNKMPHDAVSAIWFYSFDEFAAFIKWWNGDR